MMRLERSRSIGGRREKEKWRITRTTTRRKADNYGKENKDEDNHDNKEVANEKKDEGPTKRIMKIGRVRRKAMAKHKTETTTVQDNENDQTNNKKHLSSQRTISFIRRKRHNTTVCIPLTNSRP